MPQNAKLGRMPAYYLPHGGGPCFFMNWPGDPHAWDTLAAFLRGVLPSLPEEPRAIVVISAHWEQPAASVTAQAAPQLIYDYSGFPPETYELRYPAPGDPALAGRVRAMLENAGIPAREDRERGFDHGIFVPFLLVAPEARIPIVAVSLVAGLDPVTHLAIGRALEPLRDEGVLIAGSGMSYHNMAGFLGREAPQGDRFDAWLGETVAADAAARREPARQLAERSASPARAPARGTSPSPHGRGRRRRYRSRRDRLSRSHHALAHLRLPLRLTHAPHARVKRALS